MGRESRQSQEQVRELQRAMRAIAGEQLPQALRIARECLEMAEGLGKVALSFAEHARTGTPLPQSEIDVVHAMLEVAAERRKRIEALSVRCAPPGANTDS
jgi:ubiquinone/menaquinone biosynthesis C-methylase UbiE